LNEKEIEIVHKAIKRYGDDFWQEPDNEYLFDDILNCLNKAGYDLKLIKKEV